MQKINGIEMNMEVVEINEWKYYVKVELMQSELIELRSSAITLTNCQQIIGYVE